MSSDHTKTKQELAAELEAARRRIAELEAGFGPTPAEEALRQSEETFRLAFDHANDGMCLVSPEGYFLKVNKRLCDLFGYSQDEFQALQFNDLTHPEDQDVGAVPVRKMLKDELQNAKFEKRYLHKDGSVVWASLSTTLLRDETGVPLHFVTHVTDITERKQAEEALRESESRFRTTFEQAAVGIAHVAPDGRWLRVNRKLCDIVGYSREEFLHLTFQDITHPDDLDVDLEYVRQVLTGEIPTYSMEKRYFRKDGSIVWIYLTVSLVLDEAGRPKNFVSVIEDITDRKRAEEALRESREQYRNLFENAPVGIFQSTPAGKYLALNPEGARLYGFSSPEELKESISDIGGQQYVNPADREEVKRLMEEKGEVYGLEYRRKRKDGSTGWASLYAKAVPDGDGQVIYYDGFIVDIDDLMQAREALRQSEERFQQLSEMTFEAIVFHEHGVVLYANDQYFRMFGYEPEELLGKDALKLTVTSESEAAIRENITRGFFGSYEVVGRKKDGSEFPVEIRTKMPTFKGQSVRVGVIRDITERKQAEEELRQANELLNSILDNLQAIVFMRDLRGRYVFFNSHFERVYGFSQDMVIGKTPAEFLPEDTAVQRLQEDKRVLETGEPFTQEEMVVVEGEPYHFLSTKMPLYDAEGKPYAICGIAMDITDRKRTERALLESEERFRRITENAKYMVYRMSIPDGDYEYVSPPALDIFGYSSEEFRQSPLLIREVIHPDWREYFAEQWGRLLQGDVEPMYEYQIIHKSGEVRWLHQRNVLIRDEAGAPVAIEGIVSDETGRKLAEEAVGRERDNLMRILDSMEDGVAIVNEQYEIKYANPVHVREFGPCRGEKCHEYYKDRESPCPGCSLEAVLSGQSIHREDYFPHTQKTFDVLFTPLRNPDGRMVKLEIFRDITERKQAEEAVRQERDNLMRILDSMEDGVDIINDQFDIEYANPVHVRQFGPYQGKKCYEYYHDRESVCWGCIAGEVFAGMTARAESKNFYKNKDKVYDVISTPFQGFSESGNAMLEIFRDITDRKEMEEELRRSRLDLEQRVQERTGELRRSNQRLRKDIAARKRAEEALRKNQALLNAFIEGLPNQVFAKDAHGRYLMANAYLERFFEKSREDILGLDDRALLPPETAELLMASDRKVMASGEVHIFEETRKVDGRTEFWRNTKVPCWDDTGDIVGVIGIAEDITERKRAEEELRQSEKRLKRLSAQLITTQESERKRIGKELHDSLGQLLTLTKVSVEISILKVKDKLSSDDIEPLNQLVPKIQGTIKELRRIIMDLRPTILDDMGIIATIKWFCRENQEIYEGITINHVITINEDEVPENLKIVIFRIMQESVNNALKHGDPKHVTIFLKRIRGEVVLWVEDDGKGFDSDAAMQPGKTTSGFGLASMRERAEVVGGEFLIRSGSKGTKVEAVFPL